MDKDEHEDSDIYGNLIENQILILDEEEDDYDYDNKVETDNA